MANQCRRCLPRSGGYCRQRWSKEEILDPVSRVEPDDFGEDRKRRIIDHHSAGRVLHGLIVPAGIKRTDKAGSVETVFVGHPVGDNVVYTVGSVAVVGRLFRDELLLKLKILLRFILVLVVITFPTFKPVELRFLRFRYVKMKIKPTQVDLFQFLDEDLRRPRRLVGLVVDDPERLDLVLRQILHLHAWHRSHAEELRRLKPAMPDNEHVVFIDYHRLHEPEALDALGDILHLGLWVFLCVVLVRDNVVYVFFVYLHLVSLEAPPAGAELYGLVRSERI